MDQKKRLLIALPCLIPSGGINVVVNLVEVLQKMEYQVDLVSKEDGYMRREFETRGVKIRIEEDVIEENFIEWILNNYDEVLVNTLQMYGMIYKLNWRNIKVKWWIHEPPLFFEQISQAVPQEFWDSLGGNIEIYAAGNIVYDHIYQTYGRRSRILNFGIIDQADTVKGGEFDIVSPDKITFLLPSTLIQPIKGQDLLAMAIARLTEEYEKKAEFIFIGNVLESMKNYYKILELLRNEKENVKIFNIIDREELLSLMKQVDCIVAPSREDATNACIVEGLMLSKLCLCSDAAGISHYMQDCVNGFVFQSCNVDELLARIMLIIDNFERVNIIAQNGRKVYDEHFSMRVFEENVKNYWGEEDFG